MCTDKTRQELIFLLSLPNDKKSRNLLEISQNMVALIENAQWGSYLHLLPHTIKELVDMHADVRHIVKTSPIAWRISAEGIERISYLLNHYIPNDEAMQLLKVIPKYHIEDA